jgi:hypothetical protein
MIKELKELKKLKTGNIVKVKGNKLKILINNPHENDVLAVLEEDNSDIQGTTFTVNKQSYWDMYIIQWAKGNTKLAKEYRNILMPYKNKKFVWLSNIIRIGYKIDLPKKLKLKDFLK